jgi:small subunit ribosomal protein S21
MSKKVSLVSVTVVKGDINRALKKYKRKVNDSGHLLELRDRKEFTKPKVARRKQKLDAIRRNNLEVMLEKIESGDNTIRLKSKKVLKSNNKSSNSEKEFESYGLLVNKNM